MENTAQPVADLFNDAQALEKVLKLFQGVLHITAGVHRSREEVGRWNTAGSQIALSRRFFRLFKWVDCWNLAHREYEAGPLYPHLLPSTSSTVSVGGRASAKDYTAVAEESEQKSWPTANEIRSRLEDQTSVMNGSGTPKDTGTMSGKGSGSEAKIDGRAKGGDEVYTMLAVLKWTLLGMYFLMEMWTITDAMTLTSIWHRFGIDMQEEALKMWIYGIAASIVLGLYELFTLYYPVEGMANLDGDQKAVGVKSRHDVPAATAVKSRDGDRNGRHENSSRPVKPAAFEGERRSIVKQLVVDCCDILIPTSAIGWVNLDGTYVGIAGAMSAGVSLSGMWMKAATR